MIHELFEIQEDLLLSLNTNLKRYLFKQINWKNRLNVVVGMRGVGKTTLLLQYIKENFHGSDKGLYISGDNTILNSQGLFEIGKVFYREGGKLLVIDEIHKYPFWQQELKNLYDSFPKLQLLVSGSSSLDLIKGQFDLSRRSVVYRLNGLSFREFINLELKMDLPVFSLNELIKDHPKISRSIKNKIEKKDKKILKLFKDYLRFGYYPYYLEGKKEYFIRLQNAMSKVLYEDIPSVFNLKPASVNYLHKLIYMVATSSPLQPNIDHISSDLGLSKEYVYQYIDCLEKAGIFSFLHRKASGLKLVRKPHKIYLNNSNLYFTIERNIMSQANMGSIREAFALNQLQTQARVFDGMSGDFEVDGRYIFEIGGKNKDSRQIKQAKQGFILKDGIEIGYQNGIPLYLLGFLY